MTRREFAAAAAFWALFTVFRVADLVLFAPDLPAAARHLLPAAAESVCWAACTPLVVGLVELCVAGRRRAAVQAGLYTVGGVLAALAVGAMNIELRPPKWVPSSTPGLSWRLPTPYWLWVGNAVAAYLLLLGAALARAYLLRYRSQRETGSELATQLTASRLEALRRQLDPHFLFNTLSLVASLVEHDPVGARRMIARLSDLLRASLADDGAPEVPLHQELALVDRYLDIMRVRFAGRLDVDVRVDPATRDALVPPLVLQPLVENAVKHGVERSRGPARIAIEAGRDGAAVVLRVLDEGSGRADDAPAPGGHGLGLRTTRARLEALYGRDTSLTLRGVPGGGTEVEVRLPLRPTPETSPRAQPLLRHA